MFHKTRLSFALTSVGALVALAGAAAAQPCQSGAFADQTFTITQTDRFAPSTNVGDTRNQIAAGDVNNDGFDDIILALPECALADCGEGVENRGVVRVYSGADGSMLYEFTGNLFTGSPASLDAFGFRVGAADVNGDGHDDVLIAARRRLGGQGEIEVYSGATGGLLYTISGEGIGGDFGSRILSLGDVTGDGRDDLLITAPRYGQEGGTIPGAVLVLDGLDGDLISFEVGGGLASNAGEQAIVVSDLNGDGLNNYVFSTATTVIANTAPDSAGVWLRQFDITGQGGLPITLAQGPDIDGDGVQDIAFIVNGEYRPLSGATGEFLDTIPVLSAGTEATLLPVGDMDGDGLHDLAVVVHAFDANDNRIEFISSVTGESLGTIITPTFFNNESEQGGFGAGAAIGDFNNDGSVDIAVTSPRDEDLFTEGTGSLDALVFLTAPCAGDTNGDGEVSFGDLNNVLNSFGSTGAGFTGDTDCDRAVDFSDLNTVLNAFGSTCD